VSNKKKHRTSGQAKSPKWAVLDAFTERNLETWDTRSTDLQLYHDRVYYDLERQRAARYEELCEALRAIAAAEVSVDGWVRVTDGDRCGSWALRLPAAPTPQSIASPATRVRTLTLGRD